MWIVTYAEHNFHIPRKHFNHERLRTHHVVSNGMTGKTIDYRTGAIN